MIYDHAVIKDGVFYASGANVPDDTPKVEKPTDAQQPTKRGRKPKTEG